MFSWRKRQTRSCLVSLIGALAITCAFLAGCQQKMADQPSYKPLQPNEFFPDRRSERAPVSGTVARGQLRIDHAFFTGRISGGARPVVQSANATSPPPPLRPAPVTSSPIAPAQEVVPANFRDDADFEQDFPFSVKEETVRHGYNRYMIYCVVCHDPLGTGHGRIVERGYTPPPSLHSNRLRTAPPGKLFAIITEGYGSMPSYAEQIPPADRWAIVAYIRALQLSQHFPRAELTPEMQTALANSAAQSAVEQGRAAGQGNTP